VIYQCTQISKHTKVDIPSTEVTGLICRIPLIGFTFQVLAY